MKKIRVWVVLALNIVTLGIYGLFWLIRRRGEMVEQYQQKIPHWAWLVVPTVLVIVLAIVLALMGNALNFSSGISAVVSLGFLGLAMLAVAAISIWWMWKFGRAAEYVVNGRMTLPWIIVLYIFTGGLVGLFLQYYFNRSPSPQDRAKEPAQKPTTKFKVVAAIVILLTIFFTAVSTPDYQSPDMKVDSSINES